MTDDREALPGPVHFPWEELRRTLDWSLPQGERFGFHRSRVNDYRLYGFWLRTSIE